MRKPEYEALCTFDLCIGIAAKSLHVYGTLVPSCLLERAVVDLGRGPFLVGQFGRPWCGEDPTTNRLEGGTPCASDADDSKIEPVHDPITQTQPTRHHLKYLL